MTRTLIRCGSLIAFDGARHRLVRDTTLLVENDRVAAIGPEPEGPFDAVIDASRDIVLPGYVNIHTHTGSTVAPRLVAECAYPAFYNAGYLAFSPRVGTQGVGRLEQAAIGGVASAGDRKAPVGRYSARFSQRSLIGQQPVFRAEFQRVHKLWPPVRREALTPDIDVLPAKAGIQLSKGAVAWRWIPSFDRMTVKLSG
jgi:hypothetical protein